MATVTKKELIDRIADAHGYKRVLVKRVIQAFLDNIVNELIEGNRLEFRDFGVFETKVRAPREAQNPKTLEKVPVPERRSVKFKVGRVLRDRLREAPKPVDAVTGLTLSSGASVGRKTVPAQDGALQRKRG